MKILVSVNGEERSYSEQELTEALERLANFEKSTHTTATAVKAVSPEVGEWFPITPANINWTAVEEACEKADATNLWENISWAKEQMSTDPKYQGVIESLVPKKTWNWKTEKELRELATELGDEMVDEVITYLEFAQRINNGGEVDTLTKKADHLPYYRQIITRNGGTGFVGGASAVDCKDPPAVLLRSSYYPDYKYFATVPAVARFSK